MLVFITNATRPQTREDLINACCLAAGSRMTFDYRLCWIDDSVLTRNGDKWKGTVALVVYYDPRARTNDTEWLKEHTPDIAAADGSVNCGIPPREAAPSPRA